MNIWICALLLLVFSNGSFSVEVIDLESNYQIIYDDNSSESDYSEASEIVKAITPSITAYPSRTDRLSRIIMNLHSIEDEILEGIELGTIVLPVTQRPAQPAAPLGNERIEPFEDLQMRWQEVRSLLFDFICKMILVECILAVVFSVVQLVLSAYLTPGEIAETFYWLMLYGFAFGSLL